MSRLGRAREKLRRLLDEESNTVAKAFRAH
jgi:DNA-directed RNA polymerase specialized sigma24 family protein